MTEILDPLEAVPPPHVLRHMLAETTRRKELLRALLRVAIRVANYPPLPSPAIPEHVKGATNA